MGHWKYLPSLPYATSGHFAGVAGGTIVCAGGSSFPASLFAGGKKVWLRTICVLEPGARAWRVVGELPPSGPCGYGVAETWRDSLVMAGGADANRHYPTVCRLRWHGRKIVHESLPDLPTPLAYCSGAVLGDTLYVLGGQQSPTAATAQNSLFALDLKIRGARWSKLAPLPGRPRILAPTVALGGALVVASGCDLSAGPDGKPLRTYLTDAWRFRPNAGWEPLPPVPYAAVAAPASASNGVMLVFGGDDGKLVSRTQELKDRHPGFCRTILQFDGKWRVAGAYPAGMVTTHAFLAGGVPTIVGGEDRPGHRQSLTLQWIGRNS